MAGYICREENGGHWVYFVDNNRFEISVAISASKDEANKMVSFANRGINNAASIAQVEADKAQIVRQRIVLSEALKNIRQAIKTYAISVAQLPAGAGNEALIQKMNMAVKRILDDTGVP